MQYDAKTPSEYLKLLEPDWRKDKLLELRTLIKKHGPELKEGVLLAGLDVGKGCIRFKKTTKVAETRIEEFIKKAITMLRNGEDCGC